MKQTNRVLCILLALLIAFSVSTTAFAEGGLTLVSAKVGEADLENAKIPAGSEIVLTFSNNVTDESVLAGNLGKIKVKDSENNAVSATVSTGTDKTAFILTLGDLSKGTYTLTIGKELAAKNGNTLDAKIEIPFQINKGTGTGTGTGGGGGNNPLSFVSATVGGEALEGAVLDSKGTITITFDRGMTENQDDNFAQIGIYDADGKKVEGVTFTDFTKDDNGDSFTVLTFKGLNSGEYTLKLGSGLKANNGNTLGQDITISFTVKSVKQETVSKIGTFIQKIIQFFMALVSFINKMANNH